MGDLFLILIVILIIVLVVRGPKTLPQIGEVFGRGVKEARRQAGQDDAAPDSAPRGDA
jgi:Sec-independent protein translocase protein TatA